MTILYVVENYYPYVGGVETFFKTLAEHFAKDNKVIVVTSQQPDTAAHEVINGVEVVRTPLPSFLRRYFFTFLSLPAIWTHAQKADLIHTTTYNAALPAWLVSTVLGKKKIISIPEVLGRLWLKLPMWYPLRWLHWIFEAVVVKLPFDRYVAASQYTKNCLLDWYGIDPNKLEQIYKGIDYEFWQREKLTKKQRDEFRQRHNLPTGFTYLYFGRPGWVKGTDFLIEAAATVQKSFAHSHLVMLLSREPVSVYQQLLARVDELNLTNHIKILDPVSRQELPKYLKAADCVVVPSASEGFGFAAAEAIAAGAIVLARKRGSLPEVVPASHLFENKTQLVKMICQVAEGTFKRSKSHSQFHLPKMIDNYAKLYQEITQE